MEDTEFEPAEKSSNSSLIGRFFNEHTRDVDVWSMTCRLCRKKIKSKPGVTSNFHRHLRVSLIISVVLVT